MTGTKILIGQIAVVFALIFAKLRKTFPQYY